MSKPTIQVVSRPVEQPFQARAGDSDPVDVTVRKLKLRGQFKKAGLNVDVTNAITDASGGQNTMTDSITAAPQLLITVFDREYSALRSGIFGETVDVELDTVPYRLMEVDILDTFVLQLTFYHKIVALLLKKNSPLVASRSSLTRAQFIEYMLREILPDFPDLIYVCPEVNQIQPVAGSKKTGRVLNTKTLENAAKKSGTNSGGFGVTSMKIRYWDGSIVTIGPSQLHNASLILETCAQKKAPAKAVLAVMEACLVEPNSPYTNSTTGDGTSVGILQVTDGSAPIVPGGNRLDVVACVEAFLTTGFSGKGGAISIARAHPELSAGQIAQEVQGSAFPTRYDQAQSGATTVINAYQGGIFASGGASGLAAAAAATSVYNFTRGQSGQTEDSWTCGQRLAGEVQWRLFVTGRRSVWFVTDDDLMNLPAKYQLDASTEGLGQITGQVELGGRTIVRHGKRQPKPSEGQVAVRIGRLDAQAGDPIIIADHGPYDDKWVLTEIDRDLFDKTGTLSFAAPQKALKEPAATTTGGSVVGGGGIPSLTNLAQSGNPIDRVYAAAQVMDSKNLPYNFSGHTGNWKTAVVASGQDCSSSVSVVLYQAGLMQGYAGPIVSGDFLTWGAAGYGKQMSVMIKPGSGAAGHVFIEFYNRPAKRFDTVSGGSGGNGPHLRYTSPSDSVDAWEASGFVPRHVIGF